MIWWRRETHSLEKWRLMAFNYRAKRARRQNHFFISKHCCALRKMKNDRAFINKRQKLKLTYWWETYKAKTFFIKKQSDRNEWIFSASLVLLMTESWKMFPNLFYSLSAAATRKNLFVLLWNDQFNKPFHSLSL